MKFDLVLEETDFSCAAEWTAHQEAIIKGLISVDPFNPVNPVKLFSAVNYFNRRNHEVWGIQHPVRLPRAIHDSDSAAYFTGVYPVQFTTVTAQRISLGFTPLAL